MAKVYSAELLANFYYGDEGEQVFSLIDVYLKEKEINTPFDTYKSHSIMCKFQHKDSGDLLYYSMPMEREKLWLFSRLRYETGIPDIEIDKDLPENTMNAKLEHLQKHLVPGLFTLTIQRNKNFWTVKKFRFLGLTDPKPAEPPLPKPTNPSPDSDQPF